jgi:hypothetical protein
VPRGGDGGGNVSGGGGERTATVSYRSNVGHRLAVRRLECIDLSGQIHVREVSIDENNFYWNDNINDNIQCTATANTTALNCHHHRHRQNQHLKGGEVDDSSAVPLTPPPPPRGTFEKRAFCSNAIML